MIENNLRAAALFATSLAVIACTSSSSPSEDANGATGGTTAAAGSTSQAGAAGANAGGTGPSAGASGSGAIGGSKATGGSGASAATGESSAAGGSVGGSSSATGGSGAAGGSPAAGGSGAAGGSTPAGGSTSGDSLAASFAFVGCNRLSKGDWDPAQNPSSANVAELSQTITDLTAVVPAPKRFFFTGDLVLGLATDTTVLDGQLAAWTQVWSAHPAAKTIDLVPLVGNHEMLQKVKQSAGSVELSNPAADAVWTSWQAKSGFDAHAGNGPTSAAPNTDALMDDQSRLTYSFDDGPVHYVVLNTDTWTSTPDAATQSTQLGWIALGWLKNDLAAAQANTATKAIFVLGHKPIVSPSGSTTSAEAINPMLATTLAQLLDDTEKVKAYLCAHAHQWNDSKLPGKRGTHQIVAGNGGSKVDAAWTPAMPYFGFTEVRVYQSGKVGVVDHRRPVPAPYNAPTTQAAIATPELVISP